MSPVSVCKPKPAISPRELIAFACKRNKDEGGEISVLRSVITPFCQRKARGSPLVGNDPPTTRSPLTPRAPLSASPGRVPRSIITRFCQRKA